MCALRRDTWVPPYRVRRGAGGQSRPPLHALSLRASAHTGVEIRSQRGAAALTGRRGRRPLQSIAGTNVRLAAGHMGPALQSAARSGRAESSAPTCSVIASQCSHWRGNPFPARRCRADGTSRTPSPTEHRRDKCAPCGGTHGSRPTECGAERAGRVVHPYTRLSGAFHAGRRGRCPLRTVIGGVSYGAAGRRNPPQSVQRIV